MSATIRILFISLLFIGIGLTGLWVYMRDAGLNKPISPVRHPFFDDRPEEKRFLIADPRKTDRPFVSLDEIKETTAIHPNLILWLDVAMTGDGTLVVMRDLTAPAARPGAPLPLVSFARDEELGVGASVPRLSDALAAVPNHRLVLNIREYRPTADEKLVTEIENAKAGDRVLIQSDIDGFLRDMRSRRAAWLFGTSQAQITQLLMLLPFGLETSAPLKGDVYVTPASRDRSWLVKPEVVAEIHRRDRRVFAGPIDDETTVERLLELGVDGLITTRPEAFLRFLN